MNIEEIKTLYRIMAGGRMIVVRASVWNSGDEFEISQIEVLKIHHLLDHRCALSHFRFNVGIDYKRNDISIHRSIKVSPEMIRESSAGGCMADHLGAVLTAWSKKEDLLLGRNEEKKPNPWVAAQTPFLGNVFHSRDFQRIVPASHPDMLPILTMSFTSMTEAFLGMDQHVIEHELLLSFGSFVAQARRESIRMLYGTL